MKVDKSTVLFKLHFCAEYYILSQCVMVLWVAHQPNIQEGPGSDVSWKLAVLTKVTFLWSIQTFAGKVCWTRSHQFSSTSSAVPHYHSAFNHVSYW